MQQSLFKLILASQSPRRKELLGHLKVAMDVVPADIDEDIDCLDPRQMVEELSRLKAWASWEKLPRELFQTCRPLVLAADTTVSLDGQIFNKPADVHEARSMLQALSGRTHDVYTAFTLMGNWKNTNHKDAHSPADIVSRVCHSQVTFAPIDHDTLELYLESGESLDKAGAYGIQGQGLLFISKLQGSYSNVVGLPLYEVLQELTQITGAGLSGNDWRRHFVLS